MDSMFNVHFILHIAIFLTLVQLVLSADFRFEACKPKTCGGRIIRYPFWMQEDYCGQPGFGVTCKNNDPILNAAGYDYIIREIDYENVSLRVENPVIADKKCPVPFQNSTFNDQSPFKTGFNVRELSFYYNCSNLNYLQYENFAYSVTSSCANSFLDGNLVSFAIFTPPKDLVMDPLTCESLVRVPVELDAEPSSEDQGMDYMHLLKKGFALGWDKIPCTGCEKSGGYCGFDRSSGFVCFCEDHAHFDSCNGALTPPFIVVASIPPGVDDKAHDPGPRRNKIIIGVCAAIGASLLTVLAFILFRRWRRRNDLHKNSTLISRSISPDLSMQPDPEKGSSYFNTPIFTYKELEEATNNFDSSKELGDGGFGTVYYGKLKDGRAVAVKRLYENNCKRVEQFMNEVNILSLLRHQNLVSLYGCTSRHSRELLLVYEYVANGTVADHLHGEHSSAGMVTWPIRLSIAIESADALVYLHASDIIHRDVKTNNILLDKNFHVKVADFGLSRLFPNDVTHVSTAPQGTPGYVDPDYYQCYQLTDKSDVYSFGVVLCELISSKPAVDINRHRHEINLSTMALNKIHGDALHELVDMSLGFDTNASVRKTVTLVAELAYRCLQQDTDARPSMAEVLEVLKEIEVEGSKVVKPGELTDDAKLLKNYPPVSPNSVTDKWASITSTPNTSS
ncbi:LEAF RUST 10 DISEASE-RESISTANCE LOCUS RECEPTOR-LIKE PROTEIN KINASE-like 1.2 isoform X1 [Papaver somniferum]|uniref:LEAF RUST 10 DISEASE-RESISTANCE LOCUS RECEPTOR-LIKE PROTEIN KINASE-like 1.2 isoform X1 n=1 Tax=Papaver somniferum TaxID=3469 RepID=UPI000E6F6EC0|nr:LEAF RUST 10 DISEASE-RESISTANCE LOCUS RECEPTOR-LIKE PROTEIN KINASE-like 1.2 isoform X1 [Papaver somniferum]